MKATSFSVDHRQERGYCVVTGTAETGRNGPATGALKVHIIDELNGRLNSPVRPYAAALTPPLPPDRYPVEGPPLSESQLQSHT